MDPVLQSLAPILECSLCLNLVCEPISISCGHTFCRVCLVASLRRHKKQCPACRAVCHVSAEEANENNVIKQICQHLYPQRYEQRLVEGEGARAVWQSYLPIFYYDSAVFPGSSISLHLFEPRYKLMMHRIVNTSRRFAYVPNFSSTVVGEVALVAELKEVEFLDDGRVLLDAKLTSRSTVVDSYIEESTQGLHYGSLKQLKDEPVAEELQSELELLLRQGRALVSELRGFSFWRMLEQAHGEEPRCTELFSLWLVSITKTMKTSDKMTLLRSTNTVERLSIVVEKLGEWIRNEQLQREHDVEPANHAGLPIPESLTAQGLEDMVRMLTGRANGGRHIDFGAFFRGSRDDDGAVVRASRRGQRRGRVDDDNEDDREDEVVKFFDSFLCLLIQI